MSDAPPLTLVLLPGLHGTAALFEPLRRCLSPGRVVRALEYPSELAGDYAALTRWAGDALPAGDLAILGESFAGPMAVELAASHPRVRALVLASTFLRPPIWRQLLPVVRTLGPILLRRGVPDWAIRRILLGEAAEPALSAAVVEEIRRVPPAVLAARLDALLAADARGTFATLSLPTLLIVSGRDRLVPASFTREATASRPDAEVLRLDEAPHLALQTHAARAAEALEGFLARVEAD